MYLDIRYVLIIAQSFELVNGLAQSFEFFVELYKLWGDLLWIL